MVEVDQIAKENRVAVDDPGASVVIEKPGIYSLNADQPLLAVYDGEARVQMGGQSASVGKGKEVMRCRPTVIRYNQR